MLKTGWKDLRRIQFLDTHWLTIWLLIYICFLSLDIFMPGWPGTGLIKYLGIFLCVAYVYVKYPKDIMLLIAVIFTLIADTILVWTDWYVPGVYIFCFAQFMHFLRLTSAKIVHIFTCAAIVSLAFCIAIINGLQPIYAIGSIYALILLSNIYLSYQYFNNHKNDFRSHCVFFGFVAFLCCDICIALRFLSIRGVITSQVIPITNFLIWAFYYPSQVLIANSSTTPQSTKKVKDLRK